MRIAVEGQNPSAGPAAIHHFLRLDFRPVAHAQMRRISVVIVHADDVGRGALPAVIADHQPGRIECLRQMIERRDRIARGGHGRQIRHAPAIR